MKFVIFSTLTALLASSHAFAAQTYRCTTLDVAKINDDGMVERAVGHERDFWLGAYKSLVIDTKSGAVKIGDGDARDWVIEQTKVDGDWDFVANSTLPAIQRLNDARSGEKIRVASDQVRLRVGRLFVYVYNGFLFLSGTCQEIY
jgi:hypothetical protein